MATFPTDDALLMAAARRHKVLVVDDDEDLLRLLRAVLEKSGAQVYLATSGREALQLAFDQRPHLVLLDIAMASMDGYAVCERLRDLSDVPIIMLTAFDSADYVTRAFGAGADDYIIKPFQVS